MGGELTVAGVAIGQLSDQAGKDPAG